MFTSCLQSLRGHKLGQKDLDTKEKKAFWRHFEESLLPQEAQTRKVTGSAAKFQAVAWWHFRWIETQPSKIGVQTGGPNIPHGSLSTTIHIQTVGNLIDKTTQRRVGMGNFIAPKNGNNMFHVYFTGNQT